MSPLADRSKRAAAKRGGGGAALVLSPGEPFISPRRMFRAPRSLTRAVRELRAMRGESCLAIRAAPAVDVLSLVCSCGSSIAPLGSALESSDWHGEAK